MGTPEQEPTSSAGLPVPIGTQVQTHRRRGLLAEPRLPRLRRACRGRTLSRLHPVRSHPAGPGCASGRVKAVLDAEQTSLGGLITVGHGQLEGGFCCQPRRGRACGCHGRGR